MSDYAKQIRMILCACLAGLLMACEPAAQVVSAPAKSAVPAKPDIFITPKSYSVTAYGYNYTDTYIDSFEVNGSGGGNLAVSTFTAGGGGHTCCAVVTTGLPIGYKFKVKWTRDRERWCEQEVPLTKAIPPEPRYLEVHFYPDGKVEIEATQNASPPRLKLERFSRGERNETNNVNNDEVFSRCKDGYR